MEALAADHVAKKGETLAQLAKPFGATVRAIRRASRLRTTLIQARRSYKIPQTGHAPPSTVMGPIAIPPRRLPPARGGKRDTEREPVSMLDTAR